MRVNTGLARGRTLVAPQGIILCETERNEQLPESAGDYEIAKTYFYGKAKITAYRRKEGQEEE